jgi:hypothetical protein
LRNLHFTITMCLCDEPAALVPKPIANKPPPFPRNRHLTPKAVGIRAGENLTFDKLRYLIS